MHLPPLPVHFECSDLVFTIAFTIEAILKNVAFGFKPYMSFFQNIIDILIVVSSLVMLVLDTMADLSVVKVRFVCRGGGRGGDKNHAAA